MIYFFSCGVLFMTAGAVNTGIGAIGIDSCGKLGWFVIIMHIVLITAVETLRIRVSSRAKTKMRSMAAQRGQIAPAIKRFFFHEISVTYLVHPDKMASCHFIRVANKILNVNTLIYWDFIGSHDAFAS